MKNNHVILPRTDSKGMYYMSYSQANKWKKSKREYIRDYFMGEDNGEALKPYGDFGHQVGHAFELKDFTPFNKEEIKFLKTVPQFDKFETKVKLQFDGFYLKGYIDTHTKEQDGYIKTIADYKTGEIVKRKPDYESDDYIQLDLYAAALEQKYGKLPDEAYVYLIGRSGNAFAKEELKLTLELETIERKLSEEKCQAAIKSIEEIALEISEHYKIFLKLNGL